MNLPTLTCHAIKQTQAQCGHVWVPRKLPVKLCPKCKSPKWKGKK